MRRLSDRFAEAARSCPDLPQLGASGNLTLKLIANRAPPGQPANEKSIQFAHPQGRVTDAIHAWDQLS